MGIPSTSWYDRMAGAAALSAASIAPSSAARCSCGSRTLIYATHKGAGEVMFTAYRNSLQADALKLATSAAGPGRRWRIRPERQRGCNSPLVRSAGSVEACEDAGNGRLAHRGGRRRRCRDAGVSDKRHPPRRAAAVATWSFERVGRRGSPESRGESGRRGH